MLFTIMLTTVFGHCHFGGSVAPCPCSIEYATGCLYSGDMWLYHLWWDVV